MKTMNSIKEIFRIGAGPSSSHTMGPQRAAKIFLERNPRSASFKVSLFGSLAATGKGHLTDKAILEVLEPHAPQVGAVTIVCPEAFSSLTAKA